MDENRLSLEEKREIRRKRRKRNQIAAYMTAILVMLVVAAGVWFGISRLQQTVQADRQEEQQARLDEILGTEENLQVPEAEGSSAQDTEATEEPAPEPTPEQRLEEIIDAVITAMPLEDKVAGLFCVTPEAITGVDTVVRAGDATKAALQKYAVGGIVYSSKNIKSGEQLSEMIENSKLYARYPLFIAIEEEGGAIAPVADAGIGTKVDSAKTLGQAEEATVRQASAVIGEYLAELGFNVNFAPVADVAGLENSAIGNRSYGEEAEGVASCVAAAVQEMKQKGVNTCLKHFPGIGSTADNTHEGLASTSQSAETFREKEFVVFRAGIEAGADMVMVSHMAAPSLTEDNTPGSLSEKMVTDILRNELDFEGVIITDALNQDAISEYYSAEEAAILALRAGCDMLLMPENFEKAYQGVLQAVSEGTISKERIDDSLHRIYRMKYAYRLEELAGQE